VESSVVLELDVAKRRFRNKNVEHYCGRVNRREGGADGSTVPPSSLPGHEQHVDDDGGYDSDFFRDVTRNGAATTVYENLRNIASLRQFLRLLLNTSLIPFNEVRLVTQSRFYRVFQPLVFEGNKPCYAHERQQFKYYERIQERELFLKQAELNRIQHETIHDSFQSTQQYQVDSADVDKMVKQSKKVRSHKKGAAGKVPAVQQQALSLAANNNIENEDDYIDEEDHSTTTDITNIVILLS
jgi:hypothetical protein